ncbi:MAG: hypothetical protein ACE5EA_09700 [Nitrospirota bacterium]
MKRLLVCMLMISIFFPLSARGEEEYGASGLGSLAEVSGYFDIEFQATDKKNDKTAFRQHHVSIFITKEINRWNFFSEIEFEDAPQFAGDGTQAGLEGKGEVLVERVWLEYNRSDLINLRTGVMLIPTYWGVNHYPSFTLSTSRPLIVKKVFPFQIVGAMLHGIRYFNDLGIEYNLYTGNGDSDFQGQKDPNNNKAVGLKLTTHIPLNLFETFNIAAHYYKDKLKDGQDQDVYGGELLIDKHPFSLLAEYAYADIGGKTGFYIQPSMNLTKRVIGFYRYDKRDVDSAKDDKSDQKQHTLGVTFRPIPDISLKAEYFRVEPDDSTKDEYNGILGSIVIFF